VQVTVGATQLPVAWTKWRTMPSVPLIAYPAQFELREASGAALEPVEPVTPVVPVVPVTPVVAVEPEAGVPPVAAEAEAATAAPSTHATTNGSAPRMRSMIARLAKPDLSRS
jgi:hypothetical protein